MLTDMLSSLLEFSSAKDLDTLVHYEFPWPQEDTQKGRTEVCKHSDNPTYDHVTKLRIDRRSKAMLRMFKSRKLKLELFYRRYMFYFINIFIVLPFFLIYVIIDEWFSCLSYKCSI